MAPGAIRNFEQYMSTLTVFAENPSYVNDPILGGDLDVVNPSVTHAIASHIGKNRYLRSRRYNQIARQKAAKTTP